VVQLEGLGRLGQEQIDWLKQDLNGLKGQHSDCGVCAHSALGGVSHLGMGDDGQRTGLRDVAAVRVGHGSERAYPPGDAEGRGQCRVSYGDVDGLSSACAGFGTVARTDEGSG